MFLLLEFVKISFVYLNQNSADLECRNALQFLDRIWKKSSPSDTDLADVKK